MDKTLAALKQRLIFKDVLGGQIDKEYTQSSVIWTIVW